MKKSLCLSLGCLALWILFSVSCAAKNSGRTLDRQDLFSLDYGASGKAVNFSAQGTALLDFDAREGIFHILDIPSRKVMRFSSYGDILSVLYDPEGSLPPEFIQETGTDTKTASVSQGRYVSATQMKAPSLIAIDSGQILYLADASPQPGGFVVRRFGSLGKELGFLGQEGLEGTPFKNVINLHVMEDDSLAVVSSVREGYMVHRFSSEGILLSALKMDSGGPSLPVSEGYRPNVDGMSFTGKGDVFEITLKIDMYGESIEKKSGASAGYDTVESWLVTLDGARGTLLKQVRVWTRGASADNPVLLGQKEGRYVLLQVGSANSDYMLRIVDGKGKTWARYRMELPEGMHFVSALKLLQGDRLTGIVGGVASVRILWWPLP